MVKQNVPNDTKWNRVKTFSKIKLNAGKRLVIVITLQQIKRKRTIKASSAATLAKGKLRRMYPRMLPFKQSLASKASVYSIGNW